MAIGGDDLGIVMELRSLRFRGSTTALHDRHQQA